MWLSREEVFGRADVCALCHKRVSNWEMASQPPKVSVVYGHLVHNSCLMDVRPSELEKKVEG